MKKLLLSLFVGFVGIIFFCSAEEYVFNANNLPDSITFENPINDYLFEFSGVPRPYGTCNVSLRNVNGAGPYCSFSISSSGTGNTCSTYSPTGTQPSVYGPFKIQGFIGGCLNYNPDWSLRLYIPEEDNCDYSDYVPLSDYNSLLGQYNSLSGQYNRLQNQLNSCQSDLNSCQSNTSGFNDQLNNCNLSLNACNSSLTNCLQYNCPEVDYTGDLLRSNIYINNILHPGRQFVNIEIPDYIQWDYSVGDDDFNLYVGSGYDVDYIESVIDINSYRPTSEDFTNVFVSGLTLVMPYIVIVLFIVFIRKLIKRIFK